MSSEIIMINDDDNDSHQDVGSDVDDGTEYEYNDFYDSTNAEERKIFKITPGAIRRKIVAFLASKEMTQKDWREKLHLHSSSLYRFMKLKGTRNGYQNPTFYAAARFFHRREEAKKLQLKQEKQKEREAIKQQEQEAKRRAKQDANAAILAKHLRQNSALNSVNSPCIADRKRPAPPVISLVEEEDSHGENGGTELDDRAVAEELCHKKAKIHHQLVSPTATATASREAHVHLLAHTAVTPLAASTTAATAAGSGVSAAGTASKQAAAAAETLFQALEAITLEDERIFDDCDTVRSKMVCFQRDYGVTNRLLVEAMGVAPSSISKFLMVKGWDKGRELCTYPVAYTFFEKLRLHRGEPKTDHRKKDEKIHPEGFARKSETYYFVEGTPQWKIRECMKRVNARNYDPLTYRQKEHK